ncbi:Hypothetical predicted protein [Mytilus galloprovincialis]|uniref:C-type lectin domain-containing protein n=1 Tax=Mytilus galloprovincialis TaxID=29158 RepID=A0A8B6EVA3_MYTGA|nr:Hypothetical predicted protein [Mytilus galloprovincialis]
MDAKYIQFVNFKIVLCFLSSFISCHCFLIEPDNAVKPNGNRTGQFLAINEFLAEKKELTHQIEEMNHQIYRLKHENDQTITILTEQLKQKLTFVEDRLNEASKQNITTELSDLKEKYSLMAGNFSKEQKNYRDLQKRYNIQDSEVRRLTNITLELEKTVSALEKLKIVNQTMNLQTMENHVQSLQQKTSLLENNQNARNQDFLALYNMTIDSSKNVIQLKNDFSNDLLMLAENQNMTSIDVYSKMATMKDLMTENSRKVAMTACSNGDTSSNIVKFPYILTSTGITTTAWPSSTGSTTTGISAAVDCQQNDELYLLFSSSIAIQGTWSCFTVLKIN